MTNQPIWKCKANLGYVSPWDYDGAFVMEDTTGVYCPELWLFEIPENDTGPIVESRILLEKCTYINGVLSDNKFHPSLRVWFGEPERIANMAEDACISELELIDYFCSDDPVQRAMAYRLAVDTYGAHEFDQYPLSFSSRSELAGMKKRMQQWLKEAEEE